MYVAVSTPSSPGPGTSRSRRANGSQSTALHRAFQLVPPAGEPSSRGEHPPQPVQCIELAQGFAPWWGNGLKEAADGFVREGLSLPGTRRPRRGGQAVAGAQPLGRGPAQLGDALDVVDVREPAPRLPSRDGSRVHAQPPRQLLAPPSLSLAHRTDAAPNCLPFLAFHHPSSVSGGG